MASECLICLGPLHEEPNSDNASSEDIIDDKRARPSNPVQSAQLVTLSCNCGQMYHRACITAWFDKGNDTCPKCGMNCDRHAMRPAFLGLSRTPPDQGTNVEVIFDRPAAQVDQIESSDALMQDNQEDDDDGDKVKIQAEDDNSQEDIDEEENVIEELKAEVEELKEEKEELEEALEVAKDEVVELRTDVLELVSQRGDLKDELNDLRDEVDRLKSEVERLEGELEDEKMDRDEIQQELEEVKKDVEELKGKVKELEEERSKLAAALEEKKEGKEEVQEKLEEMRTKSLGDLRNQVSQSRMQLKELQNKLEQKSSGDVDDEMQS